MTAILLSILFGILLSILLVLLGELMIMAFCERPVFVSFFTILVPPCTWIVYHFVIGH